MRYLALLLLLVLLAACAPTEATVVPTAETSSPAGTISAVAYPANFREDFVQYLTVDRKDAIIRHIYVNPEALDALRSSHRIPDDTIIAIEAFQAQVDENGDPIRDDLGHFVPGEPLEMIHMAQKRADWQAGDFPSEARAGQWNFGSFNRETGAPFGEDLVACFNCHTSAPATDFLFSGNFLAQSSIDGEVQYSYCDQRRRVICRN